MEPAGGKPKIHVVTVESKPSDPEVVDSFTLQTTETSPAAQAVNLAQLLQGRLPGMTYDSAVIKTAGASPVARRNRAAFQRAHAEGAILFVLHEVGNIGVEAKDAQGLATLAGKKKADLEAKAQGLHSARKYHDAVYAALAML
ncbi:hypothetical protein [Glutamicibacter soli]